MDQEEIGLYKNLDVTNGQNFEIQRSPEKGRYLVASRDLAPGELIFSEEAVSWAPNFISPPICVTCTVQVEERDICAKCGWTICSKKCAQNPLHSQQECKLLCDVKKKIDIDDFTDDDEEGSYDYSLLTALRTFSLKGDKKKIYEYMQDSLAQWKQKDDFIAKFRKSAEFLKEAFGVNEDDICRVFAVAFTNDFSHSCSHSGQELRCMFPLTALLNHSCAPNIQRKTVQNQQGVKMSVKASRSIKKGEEIFNSYIDILEPTFVRQYLLHETKNMSCRCPRCLDPADFGLHGNTIICPYCKESTCLPVYSTNTDLTSQKGELVAKVWQCTACLKSIPQEKVSQLLQWVYNKQKNLLKSQSKDRISKYEKFLTETEKKISGSNMLLIRLKYNLVGLYGRLPGYTQQEMRESDWKRKIQLCEQILEVLKVLEPGMTVRKGRILHELYLPLAMYAQVLSKSSKTKAEAKKLYRKSVITLNLVIKMFSVEDAGSWEFQMVSNLQQNAKDLKTVIQDLKL